MTIMPNNSSTNEKNILMLFVRADGMKSTVEKQGNIFGAADSFFEVSNEYGEVVARSIVLYNDLTPKWPPIKLDLGALCEHDANRRVFISFYDKLVDNHGLIKTIVTTVDGMVQSARECQSCTSLSETKPSHDLGNQARVFIYDAILCAGTPTFGTLTNDQGDTADMRISKALAAASRTITTESDTSTDGGGGTSSDEYIGRLVGRVIMLHADGRVSPIVSNAGTPSRSGVNRGANDSSVETEAAIAEDWSRDTFFGALSVDNNTVDSSKIAPLLDDGVQQFQEPSDNAITSGLDEMDDICPGTMM